MPSYVILLEKLMAREVPKLKSHLLREKLSVEVTKY